AGGGGGRVRAGVGAEQLVVVEGGTIDDVVDLVLQRREFGLECLAVVVAQRAVRGLERQFAHADKDVGDAAGGAVGGLRQRNAVVGVADRLAHAPRRRVHARRDGEAGGIVLRAVDALAARQAFHRSGLHLIGNTRAVLRAQRT